MKVTLILICIAITMTGLAVGAILEAVEAKKELKAKKKQGKQNAKIDKETIENISAAAGNDFHNGDNILHQLAEKRK